jgi:hypothetical protein
MNGTAVVLAPVAWPAWPPWTRSTVGAGISRSELLVTSPGHEQVLRDVFDAGATYPTWTV